MHYISFYYICYIFKLINCQSNCWWKFYNQRVRWTVSVLDGWSVVCLALGGETREKEENFSFRRKKEIRNAHLGYALTAIEVRELFDSGALLIYYTVLRFQSKNIWLRAEIHRNWIVKRETNNFSLKSKDRNKQFY